jgi:hypothetical protein
MMIKQKSYPHHLSIILKYYQHSYYHYFNSNKCTITARINVMAALSRHWCFILCSAQLSIFLVFYTKKSTFKSIKLIFWILLFLCIFTFSASSLNTILMKLLGYALVATSLAIDVVACVRHGFF